MPLDHLKVKAPSKTITGVGTMTIERTPALDVNGDNLANTSPKREKKPKPPQEMIKHKCGHELPAGFFAGRHCPECCNANRKRRAELRRQKMLIDHVSKKEAEFRYPPGTEVTALKWDGAQWSGILEVPGRAPIGHSATGVKRLLNEFRDLYLESLKDTAA